MIIYILFILISWGMHHEEMHSFINNEIICLIAAELSTLMPVLGTGKFSTSVVILI